jgi:hypothetical protein
MTSQVPPDLIEHIFNALPIYHSSGLATLRACAVVHSSWTQRAQARLFHTVFVGMFKKGTNLGTLPTVPWGSLVGSLERCQHLRPLVRALIICAPLPDALLPRLSPVLFPSVIALMWQAYAETRILAHVPALESLEVITPPDPLLRMRLPWDQPAWEGSAVSLQRFSMRFK